MGTIMTAIYYITSASNFQLSDIDGFPRDLQQRLMHVITFWSVFQVQCTFSEANIAVLQVVLAASTIVIMMNSGRLMNERVRDSHVLEIERIFQVRSIFYAVLMQATLGSHQISKDDAFFVRHFRRPLHHSHRRWSVSRTQCKCLNHGRSPSGARCSWNVAQSSRCVCIRSNSQHAMESVACR